MVAVILTSHLLLFPQFVTAKLFLVDIDNALKDSKGTDYASGRTPRSCARTPRSTKRSTLQAKRLGFWIHGGSDQAKVPSKINGREAREVDCSTGNCFCCMKGAVGAVVHKPSECKSGGKGNPKGVVSNIGECFLFPQAGSLLPNIFIISSDPQLQVPLALKQDLLTNETWGSRAKTFRVQTLSTVDNSQN